MSTDNVFRPDKHQLDRELVEQPDLVKEYAEDLAEADLRNDEAKAALDLVEAELSLAIRRNPKQYKLESSTEVAIKATILTQEEYRNAQKLLFKTGHRVKVLRAAVNALEHKKRSLTLLVELHGRDYFSNVEIKGARRATEESAKAQVRKIGQFIKREDKENDE